MKNALKLSALLLASTFVLTGCGSSNTSESTSVSGTSGTVPTTSPAPSTSEGPTSTSEKPTTSGPAPVEKVYTVETSGLEWGNRFDGGYQFASSEETKKSFLDYFNEKTEEDFLTGITCEAFNSQYSVKTDSKNPDKSYVKLTVGSGKVKGSAVLTSKYEIVKVELNVQAYYSYSEFSGYHTDKNSILHGYSDDQYIELTETEDHETESKNVTFNTPSGSKEIKLSTSDTAGSRVFVNSMKITYLG